MELGISVLAVTNHNDASAVDTFRSAAAGQDITILPGFEVSSSEGIHVLCIYPPSTRIEELNLYLGQLGVQRTGTSSDLSDKPFSNILRLVRDQKGVTVAAHVVGKNGLFTALHGQARISAWRSKDLIAIQIPNTIKKLNYDIRQIVENKDPNYKRKYASSGGLCIAAINARDVVDAEDLEDERATCWIKMSKVGIEGLRQAFLDQSRESV